MTVVALKAPDQPGVAPGGDCGNAKRHCDGAGREFSVEGRADSEWQRSADDSRELHNTRREYQWVDRWRSRQLHSCR